MTSVSPKLVHQENNYGDTKEIENQKEEREEGVLHSILITKVKVIAMVTLCHLCSEGNVNGNGFI